MHGIENQLQSTHLDPNTDSSSVSAVFCRGANDCCENGDDGHGDVDSRSADNHVERVIELFTHYSRFSYCYIELLS